MLIHDVNLRVGKSPARYAVLATDRRAAVRIAMVNAREKFGTSESVLVTGVSER